MLDAVSPTETIAYSYGNSSWTDLLTSYNGQNIAYDAIGNPTSYLGYTLKWNGRQLSSLSGNNVTALNVEKILILVGYLTSLQDGGV